MALSLPLVGSDPNHQKIVSPQWMDTCDAYLHANRAALEAKVQQVKNKTEASRKRKHQTNIRDRRRIHPGVEKFLRLFNKFCTDNEGLFNTHLNQQDNFTDDMIEDFIDDCNVYIENKFGLQDGLDVRIVQHTGEAWQQIREDARTLEELKRKFDDAIGGALEVVFGGECESHDVGNLEIAEYQLAIFFEMAKKHTPKDLCDAIENGQAEYVHLWMKVIHLSGKDTKEFVKCELARYIFGEKFLDVLSKLDEEPIDSAPKTTIESLENVTIAMSNSVPAHAVMKSDGLKKHILFPQNADITLEFVQFLESETRNAFCNPSAGLPHEFVTRICDQAIKGLKIEPEQVPIAVPRLALFRTPALLSDMRQVLVSESSARCVVDPTSHRMLDWLSAFGGVNGPDSSSVKFLDEIFCRMGRTCFADQAKGEFKKYLNDWTYEPGRMVNDLYGCYTWLPMRIGLHVSSIASKKCYADVDWWYRFGCPDDFFRLAVGLGIMDEVVEIVKLIEKMIPKFHGQCLPEKISCVSLAYVVNKEAEAKKWFADADYDVYHTFLLSLEAAGFAVMLA